MKYVITALVALLLLLPSAFGSGNVVSQGISMTASGGSVSQSGSNAAVVFGDNNYVDQSICQNADGDFVTQSGANAAVVVGDNNAINQGVYQDASGNYISQGGANAVAVVGNNNDANQGVAQSAYGEEIYQTGWNSGTIAGDGNTLTQAIIACAQTPPTHTDPTQVMSNMAYIMGSYNAVNQDIAGFVLMGTSNAPVEQTGSNFIETQDMVRNRFDQGILFEIESGPLANVMQSASNEVRIGA
jgi:hypothetical protein